MGRKNHVKELLVNFILGNKNKEKFQNEFFMQINSKCVLNVCSHSADSSLIYSSEKVKMKNQSKSFLCLRND